MKSNNPPDDFNSYLRSQSAEAQLLIINTSMKKSPETLENRPHIKIIHPSLGMHASTNSSTSQTYHRHYSGHFHLQGW